MHNAPAGPHPVDRPRLYRFLGAEAVAVEDLPLEQVGDCREVNVWVGRTSMPWSVRNSAGPIWSKKMNGSTIWRLTEGKARRTSISPRSTARGTISISIASALARSPGTGSGQGFQLMASFSETVRHPE